LREITLDYLQEFGIDTFSVDENAENFYGDKFWADLVRGSWERQQLADICKVAREHQIKTFVDIGASMGVYSLVLANIVNECIAIEPDYMQFSALEKNAIANPHLKIETHRAFVTGTQGELELSPYALNQSSNSVREIGMVNLHKLVGEIPHRALIKMDIEGGEWQVLKNSDLISLLRQRKSILFLSPHVGFFSSEYKKNIFHKWKYRLRVLRELLVLFRILKSAETLLRDGIEVGPMQILKSNRIFGGSGFGSPIQINF